MGQLAPHLHQWIGEMSERPKSLYQRLGAQAPICGGTRAQGIIYAVVRRLQEEWVPRCWSNGG